MLYTEIIAVCSEIQTKHKCIVGRAQNFWILKLLVHEVSLRLYNVNLIMLRKKMWLQI